MEKMSSAATPRPCVGGVGGSMGAKRIREDENALVPAPTTPKPLIRLLVTNADLGKRFITSGGIGGIVEAWAKTRVSEGTPSIAASPDLAVETLDRVRHLSTSKLVDDVTTLTRNQMRSFLESLGCQRVSWKCEVLRKQIIAVIEARKGGKEDKDELRRAAEGAHYTQKQIKRMAIDKIQSICLPQRHIPVGKAQQRREHRGFVSDSAEVVAAMAAYSRGVAQATHAASSLPPKKRMAAASPATSATCTDEEAQAACTAQEPEISQPKHPFASASAGQLADYVENLTRNQMRDFLYKLGLRKVSWKCEILQAQIRAVLRAQSKGMRDLKQVAINSSVSMAIDSIQRSYQPHQHQHQQKDPPPQAPAQQAVPQAREVVSRGGGGGHHAAPVVRQSSLNVVGDELNHAEIVRKLTKAVNHKGNCTRMDGLLRQASQQQKKRQSREEISKESTVDPEEACKAYKGVMCVKLGEKGVKFEAHNWVWLPTPQGTRKGRQLFLGQYDTAQEAAMAYDRSVLEHMTSEVQEFVKLHDKRTKHSLEKVLGLNFPFDTYTK